MRLDKNYYKTKIQNNLNDFIKSVSLEKDGYQTFMKYIALDNTKTLKLINYNQL